MLTNKKLQSAYAMAMVFMMSEMASAASTPGAGAGRQHLQSILSSTTFGTTITVAFSILALWKWIEYLQDFQASNALTRAITPALLTFMAFAWGDVLSWVGIM